MERLSSALLDYKLELRHGSTRRLVTHAIYDAHLSPSDPPRLETWEREKKPIAEGGQGKVYLQRCVTAKSVRAVKIIRPNDNNGRQRYLQELETMIRFSHQRYSRLFVRMLGWYVYSKDICIVMEYLPEGDMHTFLRQRSTLEEGDAQTVISQIMQGISVMHKAGFAHRDVKPQNILIQRSPCPGDSSSWWVKLADFGISKDVNATMTNATGMIGTLDYMAPELISYRHGTSAIDYIAGDMWSTGATTLYLMTKLQGAHRQGFNTEEEVTQRLSSVIETSTTAKDFLLRTLNPDPGLRLDATEGLAHPWIKNLIPSIKGSIIPETVTVTSSASSESHSDSASESEEMVTLATVSTESKTSRNQRIEHQVPGRRRSVTPGTPDERLSQPVEIAQPPDILCNTSLLQGFQQDSSTFQPPAFHSSAPKTIVSQSIETPSVERNEPLAQGSSLSSLSTPHVVNDDKLPPASATERNLRSFTSTGASSLTQHRDLVSGPLQGDDEPAVTALANLFAPVSATLFATEVRGSHDKPVPDATHDTVLLTINGKVVPPQQTDIQGHKSAYLEAAYWGNTYKIVECLRDGVDINERGPDSQSALYIAACQGHEDIVRVLLDAGAAIDSPNDTNFTPLHAAIYSKQERIALLLIQRGANVQAMNDQRGTPLHHAANENLPAVITQLLASGADVNAVGSHGLTVLHIAAMTGNPEVVLQLLMKDANMEAIVPPSEWIESNFQPIPVLVRSSLSAVHLAVLYKHVGAVQCLLNFGSHLDALAASTSPIPSGLQQCALIAGEPATFRTLLQYIPYRYQKSLWIDQLAEAVRSHHTEIAYMLQDILANYAAKRSGLKLLKVPDFIETLNRWELDKESPGIWLQNTKVLLSSKLAIGPPNNPKMLRISCEPLPDATGFSVFAYAGSSVTSYNPPLVAGEVPMTKVLNGLFQVSPDLMEDEGRDAVNVLRMGKTKLGGVWYRFSSNNQGREQSSHERDEVLPDLDQSEDYEWKRSTSALKSNHGHFHSYKLVKLKDVDVSNLRSHGRTKPRAHSGEVAARLTLNDQSTKTKAFRLFLGSEENHDSTNEQLRSASRPHSYEWKLKVLITALMIWLRHVHEKLPLEEKVDQLVGVPKDKVI